MSRRISALRALAERPGTAAEGEVAAAMLARLEAKGDNPAEEDCWKLFTEFLRTKDMDTLHRACATPMQCDCGTLHNWKTACPNVARHAEIALAIRAKFKRGDRVYYNYWAYPLNAPARVVGYPRDAKLWRWIRLQFDHLEKPRAVPIVSAKGMHLSHEPLPSEQAQRYGGAS